MKWLPSAFQSNDFDFHMIARDGLVTLLRKTKPQFSNESFEVIIVQREHRTITFPNGHVTKPHEHMPSSEQWGEKGWSYRDKEAAWAKFRSLVRREGGALGVNVDKTALN